MKRKASYRLAVVHLKNALRSFGDALRLAVRPMRTMQEMVEQEYTALRNNPDNANRTGRSVHSNGVTEIGINWDLEAKEDGLKWCPMQQMWVNK